jgi:dCMP deaminase
MKNKEKFFYDIVKRLSEQSTCRSPHRGALITIEDRIVAEGWNSPVGEMKPHECKRCDLRESGEIKAGELYDQVICAHAEQNAIAQCAKFGIGLFKFYSTLWTTSYPCTECARLIVSVGINEVVFSDDDTYSRNAKDILLPALVRVRQFKLDKIGEIKIDGR